MVETILFLINANYKEKEMETIEAEERKKSMPFGHDWSKKKTQKILHK